MPMPQHNDPFSKIEWYIYRTTFVLVLIFEVAKFGKHLLESW